MKSIKKILNPIMLLALVLMFFAFGEDVNASSTTATHGKGYNLINMEYISDCEIGTQDILSDSGTLYGKMSLWAANYKFVAQNDDGKFSAYYIVLIESTIESIGKSGKNYFRNKEMSINLNFCSWDYKPIKLVSYTEGSSDAITSYSRTFTCGANIGGETGTDGNSLSAGFSGGLSFDYTQSYSSVNLSVEVDDDSKYFKYLTWTYKFTKWKDGAMISPNISSVKERMIAIYEVEDYNGNDSYSYYIESKATIFKDATWPRKNYTLSDELSLYGTEQKNSLS